MLEWIIWATAIIFSGITVGYYIRKYKQPDLVIGLYVIITAMAQILAAKIVAVGPFTAPTSIYVYPLTLLLLNIIIEFFGVKMSYRAIAVGFISQVVMLLLIWMSIVAPAASYWTLQQGWEQIFGLSIRVTVAGMIAFLVAHIVDAKLYEKLRKMSQKRMLARYPSARNALISVPVLALDSVIFISLAFYGLFDIVPLIVGQILLKGVIGVAASPVMLLVRKMAHRK